MITYGDIRPDIQNGDVLLFEGSGIFPRMIKKFTKSKYSHAAIAVWWEGRLMVLESVSKGVTTRPLSKVIKEYKGAIDWLTYYGPIPAAVRSQIIEHAQRELGQEYAKWKIIVFAHRLIWGNRSKYDGYRKAEQWYCSEIVAASYNYAGIDLVPNVSDQFTSPADLYKSSKLIFQGSIAGGKR